jgi:hypothetical protein
MLRDLGVKPSKSLPKKLVEESLTEEPLVLPSLVAAGEAMGLGEEPTADSADTKGNIPL